MKSQRLRKWPVGLKVQLAAIGVAVFTALVVSALVLEVSRAPVRPNFAFVDQHNKGVKKCDPVSLWNICWEISSNASLVASSRLSRETR